MSDPPVDLVYTWVDGDDPAWQRAKRHHAGDRAGTADDELQGDNKRYRNMGEIVYAVRSARRFAPWLRRIYIAITDGQHLPAEVLADPRVVAVPHSAIMPAAILPTFCSTSIEPYLHRIPELSEVFLYGNDDYLFWKPTPREYFVAGDRLRLRGYLQPQPMARLGARRQGYMKVANRTALMLYRRGFSRVYMPEHSYHVMRKSTCEQVWAIHGEELAATTALKFRDDNRAFSWQVLVYAYEGTLHDPIHEVSLGLTHLSFHDVERSMLVSSYVSARLFLLARLRPHTVCFNTIPPSWYDTMHSYFAVHLGAGTLSSDA